MKIHYSRHDLRGGAASYARPVCNTFSTKLSNNPKKVDCGNCLRTWAVWYKKNPTMKATIP